MRKIGKIYENVKNLPLFISFLYLISVLALFFLIFPILWVIFSVSPTDLWQYLKSPTVINAILTTVISSTITTLISVIFAIGLGYLLARKKFVGSKFVSAIIDLPMALPHSVAGISLLAVFGRAGLIGQLFPTQYGSIFTRSLIGITIAQLFVSSPILIQGAKETFELIDPELETFAQVLGASKLKMFLGVTLPLSSSGILANALVCWARAASEFGAVIFLAYYPLSAPVLVYDLYASKGLVGTLPVTVIIIIFSTLLFSLAKITLIKTQKRYQHA